MGKLQNEVAVMTFLSKNLHIPLQAISGMSQGEREREEKRERRGREEGGGGERAKREKREERSGEERRGRSLLTL